MKTARFALLGLPLLTLAHCAPLSFSSEPALDFAAYRSVRVEVTAPGDYAGYAETYLVDQLGQSSGFTQVTRDRSALTDLVLRVDLAVSEDIEIDSEGELDIDDVGSALYHATAPDGFLVDSGELEDTSEFELEVVEDLLDELEYHYIAPYRY
jgi:hypothetical protein